MATVTGLTAERMLEIEAESIVDGDVVGNNLILRRHDGTTIDAGPVKGPKGDTGPAGISAALASTPVLDVGLVGQIRAGRQLTVADFTNLGLVQPAGLFNFTDLSNLGSGGPLVNKGSVPFGVGINGVAATAAVFAGATAQALYISDVGAGDPFRIKTGSFGCWFRTARRGVAQALVSKYNPAQGCYSLRVEANNLIRFFGSFASGGALSFDFYGASDVVDDRWHFVVATFDGTQARIYVDGNSEASVLSTGLLFGGTAPLNIGGENADASTITAAANYGRVDEAFVTHDVLSDEQIRLLYCAKIAHGYSGTPKSILLNVHRRRRGAILASSDFPSQPSRLHNLNDLNDLGSNNVSLSANPGTGSIQQVAGPDGSKDSARQYSGAHAGDSGSDAGLPSLTNPATLGAWFRTATLTAQYVLEYGGAAGRYLWISSTGLFNPGDASAPSGPFVADGQWHFGVIVFNSSAPDGSIRKVYIDGKLVAENSAALTSIGLGGANSFRIGASRTGTNPFTGGIARAFVHSAALTTEQIRSLYAKGAQDLGASPKNSGDHIESFDATSIYAAFDTIEQQNLVDLAVMA